jgi:hypothetical protein
VRKMQRIKWEKATDKEKRDNLFCELCHYSTDKLHPGKVIKFGQVEEKLVCQQCFCMVCCDTRADFGSEPLHMEKCESCPKLVGHPIVIDDMQRAKPE